MYLLCGLIGAIYGGRLAKKRDGKPLILRNTLLGLEYSLR